MKLLFVLLLSIQAAACSHSQPVPPPVPIPKEESTLSWNRNIEPDMADYVVYACWTKDCTNLKAVGTVRQTALGVNPEFTVYLVGKVGTLAVTARDTYGNESEFGCFMPFDRR